MNARLVLFAVVLGLAACTASAPDHHDAGAATLAQAYARAQSDADADQRYAAVAHADLYGATSPTLAQAAGHGAAASLSAHAASAPASASQGALSLAPSPSGARSVLFGVHVASYRSEGSAAAGWGLLSADAATRDALAGLGARLDEVDLGPDKGRFLRLKAGPLASRAEADQRCAALRAAGAYCQVGDFEGRELGAAALYVQASPLRADSGH